VAREAERERQMDEQKREDRKDAEEWKSDLERGRG
jgi:hypothetical protein